MKKTFSDNDNNPLTPLGPNADVKSDISLKNPFFLDQNSTSGFPSPHISKKKGFAKKADPYFFFKDGPLDLAQKSPHSNKPKSTTSPKSQSNMDNVSNKITNKL
jgi:hypothetical protein